MKYWVLATATLLLIHGADAREHWGPPPLCPQPKVDCCPKPKPCPPKECKPKPCPTNDCCPKPDPCKPCCPPVCFERGLPTKPCCTPTAYSEPAAIDVECGWNVFTTVNFIYWEAVQGGMDLAVPGQGTILGGLLLTSSQSAVGESILFQDTDYKPGFQVGLGWSGINDNWVLYAEYTRLHGSTSTSKTAPSPDVATVNGIALPQDGLWFPSSWFSTQFVNDVTTQISSEWKYKIDFVDAQISRPFYSGTRYTVEPFFGLRGAWIRQSIQLIAPNVSAIDEAPIGTHRAGYTSGARSVGPRVGVNGNWHLGYGLRFEGNAAASLLFTSYDVSLSQESPDSPLPVPSRFPLGAKIDDLNVLRPNVDLSLGLGWGSYFDCRRFYVDLSATYDFNIFWKQNMMRYLADLTESGRNFGLAGNFQAPLSNNSISKYGCSAGDLFLHGLTIKARFDF